jgi:hypothetical protein
MKKGMVIGNWKWLSSFFPNYLKYSGLGLLATIGAARFLQIVSAAWTAFSFPPSFPTQPPSTSGVL